MTETGKNNFTISIKYCGEMENAENWADLSQCILWEMEVLWASVDNSHKRKKKKIPKILEMSSLKQERGLSETSMCHFVYSTPNLICTNSRNQWV